jgi:hypothetical protein
MAPAQAQKVGSLLDEVGFSEKERCHPQKNSIAAKIISDAIHDSGW